LRNLATAHAVIGLAKYFTGRAEDITESHVLEALRLSPRDTQAYIWMAIAGAAKLYLGRDEEAVAWFRRAIETNRNIPVAVQCERKFALGNAFRGAVGGDIDTT